MTPPKLTKLELQIMDIFCNGFQPITAHSKLESKDARVKQMRSGVGKQRKPTSLRSRLGDPLESTKAPVDMLIIIRVEKPSTN